MTRRKFSNTLKLREMGVKRVKPAAREVVSPRLIVFVVKCQPSQHNKSTPATLRLVFMLRPPSLRRSIQLVKRAALFAVWRTMLGNNRRL